MNTITLTFVNGLIPVENETITLTQINSFGIISDVVFTYKDIYNPNNFEINADVSGTQIDRKNALNFRETAIGSLNSALYSVVATNNVVVITALTENVAFNGGSNTFAGVNITVDFTPLEVGLPRINVRSPFFISSPVFDGANLVSTINSKFEVYIYEGVINVSKPSTPTYTYEKKPRFVGDNNIYIDISRQIKDFIINTYNGSLLTQSVFVEVDVTNTYDGGVLNESFAYLALNGFNLHSENANFLPNKDLLINNTSISVLQGENINLPFYRSGSDYTIEFRENTNILDTQTITAIPLLNSSNVVQNVLFEDAQSINNIRIFNTDTQEETFLDVEVITECIYDPVKITFVNRQGVLQDFYTYKVSKETIKATSESYNRSVLNESIVSSIPILSYNTSEHNKVDFNKQATKSIELNTGYIPEDNNIIIEEMLESEYIWLNLDTNITPVNLSTKSVPLLTKINDQLIKYTLNFDFSYNEVQNIR
jgi:hypothetical protein